MTDASSAGTTAPSEMSEANAAANEEASARRVRVGKKKSKSWTRAAHMTRGAAKRTQASGGQEELAQDKDAQVESLVTHVYERDPKTYGEAIHSAERKGWDNAMQEELQALEENGVCRLVKRPKGAMYCIRSESIRQKTNAGGILERLKARLVDCGNEQVFGVDYQLTFAAVMNVSAVKVILALAAICGVPAKHGCIPNVCVKADKKEHQAFLLHVYQAKDVSADTLRKLGVEHKKNVALELYKSLYGLNQAGYFRVSS